MFVKPSQPGLKVPHAAIRGRYIAEQGEEVEDGDPYYLRRLRDGDLVEAEPEAPKPAEPDPAGTAAPGVIKPE